MPVASLSHGRKKIQPTLVQVSEASVNGNIIGEFLGKKNIYANNIMEKVGILTTGCRRQITRQIFNPKFLLLTFLDFFPGWYIYLYIVMVAGLGFFHLVPS